MSSLLTLSCLLLPALIFQPVFHSVVAVYSMPYTIYRFSHTFIARNGDTVLRRYIAAQSLPLNRPRCAVSVPWEYGQSSFHYFWKLVVKVRGPRFGV